MVILQLKATEIIYVANCYRNSKFSKTYLWWVPFPLQLGKGSCWEANIAKGFSQVEGIDYNETFAPVEKMNSIRLVLSLAALHNWEVHQMDVKSAFVHGDLHE